MSIIRVETNHQTEIIDFENIENKSYIEQIELINTTDKILLNINKNKHQNAKEIINYIKSIRSPEQLDTLKITLLRL